MFPKLNCSFERFSSRVLTHSIKTQLEVIFIRAMSRGLDRAQLLFVRATLTPRSCKVWRDAASFCRLQQVYLVRRACAVPERLFAHPGLSGVASDYVWHRTHVLRGVAFRLPALGCWSTAVGGIQWMQKSYSQIYPWKWLLSAALLLSGFFAGSSFSLGT